MPNYIELDGTSFDNEPPYLITLKNAIFDRLKENRVNYLEGYISILGTPVKEDSTKKLIPKGPRSRDTTGVTSTERQSFMTSRLNP